MDNSEEVHKTQMERAIRGESKSDGSFFGLGGYNEVESRAAQRGHEAGQFIKAQNDAIKKAKEDSGYFPVEVEGISFLSGLSTVVIFFCLLIAVVIFFEQCSTSHHQLTNIDALSPSSASSVTPKNTYVTPSSTNIPDVQCTIVGVPSGDQLNIRSGPGMNFQTVTTIGNGFTVIITGSVKANEKTDWYPVRVGRIEGWVCGKFLKRQ